MDRLHRSTTAANAAPGACAAQATLREAPFQNGARSSVFSTLPAPDSGSSLRNSMLFGVL
ncbi:hypothetical protein D3C80_2132060 [compost metagenome]